jgi:ribose transport system ATP-binding protein
MNVLSGVYPPDAGSVELEGREVRFRNPSEARDAGIAMIFQELNLAANLTVAENIFLGREPLDRWGLVDTRRMEREARFWLARMDAELPPDALVGELRVGRQQVVEIARALSADARVLILDEPTSALGEHEVEVLFRVLADLKRQGVAMAYITHKFEELARIADDLVVMRDGRVVGSATYGQMSRDQLVRLMVGREAVAAGRVDRVPVTDVSEVLAVEGLSLRHPERPGDFLLREISFTLRRGEILGVFGLMGAGRTELLETLFGVHPHGTSGTVRLHGSPVRLGSPAEAIRRGLALAPEDRKGSGLVLDSSVAVNHTLACLDRFERWGLLDEGAERESAKQAVNRFRIRTPSVDQPVRLLSGGNQQKVILGKWLTTSPEVLLLDEPTRGIDVNAKQEIYELIRDLAGQGLAVIMASSELPEVLAFTHRILVLCEGRLTGVLEAAEATEADILEAALPA